MRPPTLPLFTEAVRILGAGLYAQSSGEIARDRGGLGVVGGGRGFGFGFGLGLGWAGVDELDAQSSRVAFWGPERISQTLL